MSEGRIISSSVIIFDIGQVLVKFDNTRTIEYFTLYTSDSLSGKLSFPESIVRDYENGGISDYRFYQKMSQAMSLSCSYGEFFIGWNKMFIEPVDGIEELLKILSKDYKLLALSNTSPSHIKYLTHKFGFFNFFCHIITSYELKALKPDRDIYKKAEEKYFPRQMPLLYIDDLVENVTSAEDMGWPAYKFENVSKLKNFLKEKSIL